MRNDESTTRAGTRSFGARNSAEMENNVCAPSTWRTFGTLDDVQIAVTAKANPAYASPIRKSMSRARIAPAIKAPVMPPSAYVACIHCSTGLPVRASARCAATLR